MSFVLDALKVSERRRSKFARPVYAHPPRPNARGRRRRWFAVLAVVAVLAGVFLAWRLLIPTSVPAPAERSEGIGAGAEPGRAPQDVDLTAHDQTAAVGPVQTAEAEQGPAAAPQDLPAEIAQDTAPADWPRLSLQMLFHSPQAGRSFVQINGRSYREGERLDDGPEVLAIAPDSVVLAYRDARVRLAMQQ